MWKKTNKKRDAKINRNNKFTPEICKQKILKCKILEYYQLATLDYTNFRTILPQSKNLQNKH